MDIYLKNVLKENEEMSIVLEAEMDRRAKLLDEKAQLVDKLEDFGFQINDANK